MRSSPDICRAAPVAAGGSWTGHQGRGHWRRLGAAALAAALVFGVAGGPIGRAMGSPAAAGPPRVTAAAAPGLASLKAVNYDRADAGWTNLWQRWNLAQTDHDFARIAALSANAVRFSIQPSVFGWPTPTAAMESELTQTVSLASAHGLRVELTLFGWWGSYVDLSSSDRWATAVLAPFLNDPRIAFIELQNEIHPENPLAMVWAGHELAVIKQAAGTIPVTVSVSNDASFSAIEELRALKVALVATPPDFFDLHVYGQPGLAYAEMAEAKALVAPAALYIGEVGSSSLTGPTVPTQALAEAAQDQNLRIVEWAAQANGLPPAGVWTYQDFVAAGVPAAALLPDDGYYYGLFRADGTAKPAAVSLAALFATGTIDTGFNNGFESASDGQPTLWQQYRPGQGTFAWDPATAHSGRASVRLSQTTGDATGTPSFDTTPIITPQETGQRLQVTVWAKGASATGTNNLSISWFGANGTYLGLADSNPLPAGTTPWSQLSLLAAVPPGALYEQIFVKSANNSGTVWYDDVTLTTQVVAAPPPSQTEGPPPPLAGAISARPVQGIIGPAGPLTVAGGRAQPILTSAPASAHFVAVTQTASRNGSWVAATDGAVYTTGDAGFYGSMAGHKLNKPINGMTVTPSGHGYWLVAADGGIFSFGEAVFYGSMGGSHLNQPVVGMAATPSGHGYWLVAADGGIFSFGDGVFYGSTGSVRLNAPVIAMIPTLSGRGYWFVASDGGVFCFGDASFKGSAGNQGLRDISGMLPAGDGYYLIRGAGQVLTFGKPGP